MALSRLQGREQAGKVTSGKDDFSFSFFQPISLVDILFQKENNDKMSRIAISLVNISFQKENNDEMSRTVDSLW